MELWDIQSALQRHLSLSTIRFRLGLEFYPAVATRNGRRCRWIVPPAEVEEVATENKAMEAEQKALSAKIRAEDIQTLVELDRLSNPPLSPSPKPDIMLEDDGEAQEEEDNVTDFDVDVGGGTDDASDNEAVPDVIELFPGEGMNTTADWTQSQRSSPSLNPEPNPSLNHPRFTRNLALSLPRG